ncbi:MAG: YebC/PmpR family DNA-binding transcriptional regulator [Candidatus Lambdaproteobacteria bacterium]|nr:YebC/PmpR family DNA-binding transcriptional regulator [Candidatus Lambdaproteobacteria bacterium]
MSGHSKWSTIKHKKAGKDARRGKLFTKLIREITVAAKTGGGDVNANSRLRLAVNNARGNNMPTDTIKRAINKGIGGDDGQDYETVIYEGYGPNRIAVVVEALTDNRNRTIASLRTAFNKFDGTLGGPNTVLYMFDRKGVLRIPTSAIDEDRLTETILEAGAEDLDTDQADYVVTCPLEALEEVKAALEQHGIEIRTAELAQIPQTRVMIDDKEQAEQVLGFLELLEEDDDVQNVFSNFDLSDAVVAALGE